MSEERESIEVIAAPEFQRRIRDLSKKYRRNIVKFVEILNLFLHNLKLGNL
jgi:mRNA-degrading endonuclease RelE of RelBE toxin-antitoxin system